MISFYSFIERIISDNLQEYVGYIYVSYYFMITIVIIIVILIPSRPRAHGAALEDAPSQDLILTLPNLSFSLCNLVSNILEPLGTYDFLYVVIDAV